jgi:protein-S-isoprenylcysteine O-methyltransferase Ste14
MLMSDHFAKSGATLFRWRSFVLGGFLPFVAYATWRGELIEIQFGDVVGEIYEAITLAMIVVGLAIRAYTVGHVPAGTSGRNTRGQVANSLNTTGIYSVVRNPLYLGNAISYVGAVLYPQTVFLGVAMVLILVIYFERIIATEERFLVKTFGPAYTNWASKTPAFIPNFRKWQPPALPFKWRIVMRREHPTWLGAISLIYLLELGSTYVEGEPLLQAYALHALFALAVIAQLTIVWLKKNTQFFVVEGR